MSECCSNSILLQVALFHPFFLYNCKDPIIVAMPPSPQHVKPNTRERGSQNWAARAAELKLQLMAAKDRMGVQSEISISEIESQRSAVSMSTNSTKTTPKSLAASTHAQPPTSQNIMSALDHDEAQKLQKDFKELEKIIAFGAARKAALDTAKTMKLPHGGPFAPKHTISIPPKPSINMTDHNGIQAKEAEIADTKKSLLNRQFSTDADKDKTITSCPPQDIKNSKSAQVQRYDGSKHLDDNRIDGPQHEKQRKSSRREADTPEDGEIRSSGSQASSNSTAPSQLLPSAPLSRSVASKTPASATSQQQTSHHSKKILPVQKLGLPEKSVSKPNPRSQTPPTAPRSQGRHGWELQHYRPSTSEAQAARDHDPRGTTRKSLNLPPLAPYRPDSFSRHKNPRDSYPEHDKPTPHDRDLADWLSFTGWHNREFRADFLQRKRRLAHLEREKHEIEQERAELMAADPADERGRRPLRFNNDTAASYRSNSSSVRDGADAFESVDYYYYHPSRHLGRELFRSSPAPGHRRKRGYTSDGENEAPRKMNRMDTGGRRRESSSNYGPRGDFFRDTRKTPDRLAREYLPPPQQSS